VHVALLTGDDGTAQPCTTGEAVLAGCRARTGPSKTDRLPMQSRFG
jgi:hypothetical protein